ncbi:hypothetical protein BCR44DRAFT_1436400, partial [Catenaria anguillulae PL171]
MKYQLAVRPGLFNVDNLSLNVTLLVLKRRSSHTHYQCQIDIQMASCDTAVPSKDHTCISVWAMPRTRPSLLLAGIWQRAVPKPSSSLPKPSSPFDPSKSSTRARYASRSDNATPCSQCSTLVHSQTVNSSLPSQTPNLSLFACHLGQRIALLSPHVRWGLVQVCRQERISQVLVACPHPDPLFDSHLLRMASQPSTPTLPSSVKDMVENHGFALDRFGHVEWNQVVDMAEMLELLHLAQAAHLRVEECMRERIERIKKALDAPLDDDVDQQSEVGGNEESGRQRLERKS